MRNCDGLDFEPAPSVVLRTILQHMRLNGWSTREELRKSAGISDRTLTNILADDLQLRLRRRKTGRPGPGPYEFNLPLLDKRGRWIYGESS